MSTTGLFIPTYGRPAKEQQTSRKSIKIRELPSKSTASSSRACSSSSSKRSRMPSLVFNGNIEYVQSFEAAEKAAQALEAARPEVLGFDMEWQVSFVAGEAPRPTATLQLCVPGRPNSTIEETTTQTQNNPTSTSTTDSSCQDLQQQQQQQEQEEQQSFSVWGTAFIFHLCTMRGHPSTIGGLPSPPSSSSSSSPRGTTAKSTDMGAEQADEDSTGGQKRHNREPAAAASATAAYLPDSLVRVLSNPAILLAGVGVGGDVSRLEREYEQLRATGVRGVVDLSEVAKRKVVPERRRRGMWSLADLCAEMLQLELRKPSSLRTGSWEKCPLSVDQLFYAAADAYAGLRIWQVMHGMPDLVLQQSEANAPKGGNTGDDGGYVTAAGARGGSKDEVQGYARAMVEGKTPGATPTENKAPTSSSVRQRLPQSKLETHRLWHEDGLSVDAVAEVRCNKASTVRGYLSDCIEAGLPYDWRRLGVDSEKEDGVFKALLAVTKNHAPPTATGHDTSTTAAPPAGSSPRCERGKKTADVPEEGAPGEQGIPTTVTGSSHACGNAVGAVGSCSGSAATTTAGAMGHGDRSSSSDGAQFENPSEDAEGLLNGCSTNNCSNSVALACSVNGANGGSGARGKATGEGADGAKSAGEIGRWDSVKLKEVKELAPGAEYWEIRMVLARLKSGWCGYGY